MAESVQLKLNRLSKWISLAFFGVVLLWRHDAKALWAAMGFVLNFILSAILKSVLNHKRPTASKRSDPGMASSHSQSIFYIAIFTLFSVVERLGVNGHAVDITAMTLACASYLSWLRVLTGQHTMIQVIAGVAAGYIFCTYWSYMWDAVVLHAFISFLWIRILFVLETAAFWAWFVTKLV